MSHGAVWSLVWHRDGIVSDASLETLAQARLIGQSVAARTVAVCFGDTEAETSELLALHGADGILRATAPQLTQYAAVPHVAALAQLIDRYQPRVILVPQTGAGREVAPRVAARSGLGMVADCSFVRVDAAGMILATRPALDGRIAQRVFAGPSSLVMIPPGIFAKRTFDRSESPQFETVALADLPEPDTELLSSKRLEPEDLSLDEVPAIVAGGLGMGGEDGFRSLDRLASVIGAKVAASRRATDLGWADRAALVGQTGKTVRPSLYVACGISGATQHILGMWESQMIVAVNSDPNAPIFGIADIGVVGDVAVVIPELAEAFRRALDDGDGT